MKPEVVRNVLESYVRAWATGDKALVLSLFAPDCEWSDPVGTPPFRGHEGVARFWDFAHQDPTRLMTPKVHRIVVCANEGILNFTMQVRLPHLNQGLDLNITDRFVLNEAGKIPWRRPTGTRPACRCRKACSCSRPTSRTPTRSSRARGLRPGGHRFRPRRAAGPGGAARRADRGGPARGAGALPGGTAWLILRHEDVGRAFRDPQQFPAAAANLRYSLPVQGRTLLCMEGEEHRIHRALVAEAFQPQAVQEHARRGCCGRWPTSSSMPSGRGASWIWSPSTATAIRCA